MGMPKANTNYPVNLNPDPANLHPDPQDYVFKAPQQLYFSVVPWGNIQGKPHTNNVVELHTDLTEWLLS